MSKQIITYPYPPMVQLENGDWYEMPDPVTLVKMVYGIKRDLREIRSILCLLSEKETGKDQCDALYRAESEE